MEATIEGPSGNFMWVDKYIAPDLVPIALNVVSNRVGIARHGEPL